MTVVVTGASRGIGLATATSLVSRGTPIVGVYRAILLENSPPDWGPLATLWVVSVAAFFGGHAWFYKVKKSFADLI